MGNMSSYYFKTIFRLAMCETHTKFHQNWWCSFWEKWAQRTNFCGFIYRMWYVSLLKYLFILQYQFLIAHNDLDYKDDLFQPYLMMVRKITENWWLILAMTLAEHPPYWQHQVAIFNVFRWGKSLPVYVCLRINCCMKQRIISWGTV